MILKIHTGMQRRAAGTARNRVGEVTAEEHAFGRERVEIWRANYRMIER
jgi:hypothetical protein